MTLANKWSKNRQRDKMKSQEECVSNDQHTAAPPENSSGWLRSHVVW